jgi:hypothetical protein
VNRSESGRPTIICTIRWAVASSVATEPAFSPSRRTVIRSQIAKTSSSRCEMKMTARPRCFSP